MSRAGTSLFMPPSAAGAYSGGFRSEAPEDDLIEGKKRQYRRDILEGKRMLNGAKKLSRLTGRHVAIIKLHLLGLRNKDIAEKMKVTDATVSIVLRDPLSQRYLQRSYEDIDLEFNALYGKSVGVLSEAMDSDRMADRLRSVDIIFKGRGKYLEADQGKETAEDVIKRVLALQVNVNVNVNNAEQLRLSANVLENDDG